jgi:hypothetical protein
MSIVKKKKRKKKKKKRKQDESTEFFSTQSKKHQFFLDSSNPLSLQPTLLHRPRIESPRDLIVLVTGPHSSRTNRTVTHLPSLIHATGLVGHSLTKHQTKLSLSTHPLRSPSRYILPTLSLSLSLVRAPILCFDGHRARVPRRPTRLRSAIPYSLSDRSVLGLFNFRS